MVIKYFIISCMVITTLYTVSEIRDGEREVKVGDLPVKKSLSTAGCVSMAAVTIGFNAVCAYLLACVV